MLPTYIIYLISFMSVIFFSFSQCIGKGADASIEFGGICIGHCNFGDPLFPRKISPTFWDSCKDAFEYSWVNDFSKDLVGISSIDRIKLSQSSGYCPQIRCQLSNISSLNIAGHYPSGLCYTKVENGRPTFGTCVFDNDGYFNSGQMIGYYNKTQSNPKPIYKKNRIILNQPIGKSAAEDESYQSFINANEVYPNLILTQCPLTPSLPSSSSTSSSSTSSHDISLVNTLTDFKQMIIEKNITLIIQLAPSSLSPTTTTTTTTTTSATTTGAISVTSNHYLTTQNKKSSSTNNCINYVELYFANSSSFYSLGITNFHIVNNQSLESLQQLLPLPYIHYRYDLTAIVTNDNDRKFRYFSNGNSDQNDYGNNESIDRDVLLVNPYLDTTDSKSNDHHYDNNNESRDENPHPISKSNPTTSGADESSDVSSTNNYHQSSTTTPHAQILNTLNKLEETATVTVSVDHIWYYQWADFSVPPIEDNNHIFHLANTVAKRIQSNGTVAVHCLSGRGRSGTFAAIVAGIVEGITNVTSLVDITVDMRESRDSVVETPRQFRYIVNLLNLTTNEDVKENNKSQNNNQQQSIASSTTSNNLTVICFPKFVFFLSYFACLVLGFVTFGFLYFILKNYPKWHSHSVEENSHLLKTS